MPLKTDECESGNVLIHWSPIHTARWSRKIARKLPECLLCERKHVPGLIPGLIPGWDLVTLPGSVPERALCEQKPDQCRKRVCRSDDALYRSTVLPGVLKADQRSHDEKYVNWNEAAIRELLTIRAEAEIILQFSEMVSAHYTRHMKGHVSLRVVCECTHRFQKITGSVNAANLTIRVLIAAVQK